MRRYALPVGYLGLSAYAVSAPTGSWLGATVVAGFAVAVIGVRRWNPAAVRAPAVPVGPGD